MRILLTLAFAVAILDVQAQRFFLDSLSSQNGHKVFNPGNPIGNTLLYGNHFIFTSDSGRNNNPQLMYIENKGIHYIADSISNAQIPADFQITYQNGYYYYTLYDNTKGYKLYRFKTTGNVSPPDLINTNYPSVFNPLQGFSLKNSSIYIFNDSAGHLQLLAFNTATMSFQSNLQIGKYKAVNTKTAMVGGKMYFNVINDLNEEILYSVFIALPPTLTALDTISRSNTNLNLSALQYLDGNIFYASHDVIYGYELTRYNLQSQSSKVVRDLAPGNADGVYSNNIDGHLLGGGTVANNNAILLFTGSTAPGSLGYQLYAYNLATDSIWLVHQLTRVPVNGSLNARCANFQSVTSGTYNYSALYFSGMSDTNRVLWVYDGVDTPKIVSFPGVPYLRNPSIITGTSYFVNQPPHSQAELYFTGNNDGVKKIYRIIDTMLQVSVEPLSHNKPIAVRLYPNPTTGDARIDLVSVSKQKLHFSVINTHGQEVYRNEEYVSSGRNHTINLPLAHLPTGIYICHIINEYGDLLHAGQIIKH